MKFVKKLLLGLLVLFIIAQVFGPKKNQSSPATFDAFLADTNPPQDVKQVLVESCFDCHSDHTRYPWYNNITPVNYWLADHIKDGKKHFNISQWNENSTKRKDKKMKELAEEVEKKWMPLESYTYAHSDAKLTDAQIKSVVDWAKNVRFKYSLEPQAQ